MSYLKMAFKNAISVACVFVSCVTGITGFECGYNGLASFRLAEIASMRLYELEFAQKKKKCDGMEALAYTFTGSSWNKKTISWTITEYSSKIDQSVVDKTAERAFATWAEHIPFKFERIPVSRTKRADIRIRFGRALPNAILGVTQFFSRVMDNYGGDIAINDQVTWSHEGRPGASSFIHVLVHEIGHALGLGHSEFPQAVMYPSHNPRNINPYSILHSDDIQGIQAIYGTREGGPPSRDKDRSNNTGESNRAPRAPTDPPRAPVNPPRTRYNPPQYDPPPRPKSEDPSLSMPPISKGDPIEITFGPIMNGRGELIVYARVSGRCGPYLLDAVSGAYTSYF